MAKAGTPRRKKRTGRRVSTQEVPAPTQKQIAERIKEIQATWDEATRRKRAGLSSEPEPYEVPIIEFLGGEFQNRNIDWEDEL